MQQISFRRWFEKTPSSRIYFYLPFIYSYLPLRPVYKQPSRKSLAEIRASASKSTILVSGALASFTAALPKIGYYTKEQGWARKKKESRGSRRAY